LKTKRLVAGIGFAAAGSVSVGISLTARRRRGGDRLKGFFIKSSRKGSVRRQKSRPTLEALQTAIVQPNGFSINPMWDFNISKANELQ
jgi:hypothetical protein